MRSISSAAVISVAAETLRRWAVGARVVSPTSALRLSATQSCNTAGWQYLSSGHSPRVSVFQKLPTGDRKRTPSPAGAFEASKRSGGSYE